MASYIIDEDIESKEACWATILDLEIKKYLIINKDKLNNYNIIVTKKDDIDLYLHEKYILNCLKNEKKIDLYKFSEEVLNDCKNNKFVAKKNKGPSFRDYISLFANFIYLIYTLTIPVFIYLIAEVDEIKPTYMNVWLLYSILLAIFAYFDDTKTKTIEGMNFAIDMMGLRNYIRDYSLLNEKDIKDNKITGRYLPFSIILGEAKRIESEYMINSSIENKYFK